MIKSFSKINLSLRVMSKMKNGLHNIESNVVLINLYDEIKLNKILSPKDKIIFKGKFRKFVKKTKNSIVETLKILRNEKIINNNYKIVVNKRIPVFGGLGGGTSNSAFLFRHFYKKKINKKILNKLNKKVGSDFNIFFQKQSFQKSLHNFIKYKKKHSFHLVLIYPYIKCSTKDIYSKIKTINTPSRIRYEKLIIKKNFFKLIKKDTNDLQKVVENKFSAIKNILNFTSYLKGCILSRMSGSGSVCYAIFNQKKLARAAMIRVKRKYPNFWCVTSKTI
jgi:4-diphosphocytidyl-2-C-methyl-D-erythritol kinase